MKYLPNLALAAENLARCIATGESDHPEWPKGLRVLIEFDELCNAVVGRHCNTTISHHLGLEARKHGGTVPWRKPLEAIIYRWLERIDPGHCERSIEVE